MSNHAVVTDAVDADFFFPIWYSYYSAHFGASRLYVITYPGKRFLFEKFRLGGIFEMPSGYNDNRRAAFISSITTALLDVYDGVVRVDVDEFVVPDLRRYANVSVYLETVGLPYITARGFDVIQVTGETPIELSKPFLITQRSFAYPNSSLNKTFFSTLPLQWSVGFHGANVYPRLGECFILHLKRLDIDRQLAWARLMNSAVTDDPVIKDYYNPEEERIRSYHRDVSARSLISGWEGLYRDDHNRRFFRSLSFDKRTRIYTPDHFHEDILVRIPAEFEGTI